MTQSTVEATTEPEGHQFLAGYLPLKTLWEGEDPLYPSEQSARWAVRTLGKQLAEVEAIAIHRRELLVRRDAFVRVIEDVAKKRFQRRMGICK